MATQNYGERAGKRVVTAAPKHDVISMRWGEKEKLTSVNRSSSTTYFVDDSILWERKTTGQTPLEF
ncbi:hypothetical protein OK016_27745 [Vibrio chagasii]|nr:hypothetical protein [Vibrio chagasii]